jgi:hypothetical protein
MQKYAYVSTFLFLFIVAQAPAKVWVVNANGTGNFTTLTSAINSAAGGDTIFVAPGGYVESPSATTKMLTVLGIGFSSNSTTTWSIILDSTLALGTGSVISGLELRGSASPLIKLSLNSHVEKCHIVANGKDGIHIAADSCAVRQNVLENIQSGGSSAIGVDIVGSYLGITILNNVITHFANDIYIGGNGDELVANNIILSSNTALNIQGSSFSGKVFSNIFEGSSYPTIVETAPSFYCAFNDFWSNQMNNIPFYFDVGSILTDPKFINYSSTTGYVYGTSNFHLAAGSPCIDDGEPNVGNNDRDGSRNDMGIYGGPYQFDDTGTPIYPCVITVIVSPYAAPLNGTITIKALGRIGQ